MYLHSRSDGAAASAGRTLMEIRSLAGAESLTLVRTAEEVPSGCAMELVSDAVSVYVSLAGTVDAMAEVDTQSKKLASIARSQAGITRQQTAPDYEAKVPERIRADNADKAAKLAVEAEEAERALAEFQAMLLKSDDQ